MVQWTWLEKLRLPFFLEMTWNSSSNGPKHIFFDGCNCRTFCTTFSSTQFGHLLKGIPSRASGPSRAYSQRRTTWCKGRSFGGTSAAARCTSAAAQGSDGPGPGWSGALGCLGCLHPGCPCPGCLSCLGFLSCLGPGCLDLPIFAHTGAQSVTATAHSCVTAGPEPAARVTMNLSQFVRPATKQNSAWMTWVSSPGLKSTFQTRLQ